MNDAASNNPQLCSWCTTPTLPLHSIFFCNVERPKIKEENPEIAQTDIMKELGKRWKDLGDDDKAPFIKQAEEDKARYEEEMKEYVGSLLMVVCNA